ncbi:hypothetical protein LAD12857_34030 [Lacrimispora amygdalina]|uniref:Uncharacterized protein n=1 Tax=Lacrimispora amygdalina TaxID=253257 RepID=A0ABQ5M950_9FIRM
MKIHPLNEEAIREIGWSDIYVSGYSEKVHIFHYRAGVNSKNIIVLHTPVTAVKNCYECYEQLGRIYGFNVFAVDYVPGEGECSGETQDFTLLNMVGIWMLYMNMYVTIFLTIFICWAIPELAVLWHSTIWEQAVSLKALRNLPVGFTGTQRHWGYQRLLPSLRWGSCACW